MYVTQIEVLNGSFLIAAVTIKLCPEYMKMENTF